MRVIITTRFSVLALCVSGCAISTFVPAPPQGATYQYDYQGFRSSDTTVVAGASKYGPAYAGVFAFRDRVDVHPEKGGKEPFAQSTPIDGYRFNTHLQNQGVRLVPPGAVPFPTVTAPLTEPPK